MRRSTHFPQFIAPSDAQPRFEALGSAEVVEQSTSGVRLRCGRATIEVAALANDLFRVGIFGDGRPVSYRSNAVAKTEWPIAIGQIRQAQSQLTFGTTAASAHVSLDPLRIGFS